MHMAGVAYPTIDAEAHSAAASSSSSITTTNHHHQFNPFVLSFSSLSRRPRTSIILNDHLTEHPVSMPPRSSSGSYVSLAAPSELEMGSDDTTRRRPSIKKGEALKPSTTSVNYNATLSFAPKCPNGGGGGATMKVVPSPFSSDRILSIVRKMEAAAADSHGNDRKRDRRGEHPQRAGSSTLFAVLQAVRLAIPPSITTSP